MAMNHIVAFLITTAEPDSQEFKNASQTLYFLAREANFRVSEGRVGNKYLFLVGQQPPELPVTLDENGFSFSLCPQSGISIEWDRFLKIKISGRSINVENDYAGTVPVFYSQTKYLSISNIASCIEKLEGVGFNDLSPASIYGFLRFSHFIWDETAFSSIKQLIPDSSATFRDGAPESIVSKGSIHASSSRVNSSDKAVADDLFELNRNLVLRTLGNAETIILPLSAGYDSRMIFSVLASDKNQKKKLRCFTYGEPGCIEVEAARELCKHEGVSWRRLSLPCKFLSRNYLDTIYHIFGSSLHMHGMYQLEFFDELKQYTQIQGATVLTSGFMTGVPAGQHNRLLNISNASQSLCEAMTAFGQSQLWTPESLAKMPLFASTEYTPYAEEKFKSAFNAAPGETYHKSIIFDIWTRQRNFISYYPRTLEWRIPTVSPHMNAEYANFYLSLSQKHLDGRRAVELMFSKHYPTHAAIVSNSNGLKTLSRSTDSVMYLVSKLLSRFGSVSKILPRKFWATNLWLDIPAIQTSGAAGFYPIQSDHADVQNLIESLCGTRTLETTIESALRGNAKSYDQLVMIQALAYSLLKAK